MSHEIGTTFYYSGIIVDGGVRHPIRIQVTREKNGYRTYASGMEDKWHIPRFASSSAPKQTLDLAIRSLNSRIKEVKPMIEM